MGFRIRDNIIKKTESINDNHVHTGLKPLDGDGGGLSKKATKTYRKGYHNAVFSEDTRAYFSLEQVSEYYNCDDTSVKDPAVWSFFIRIEA